MEAVRCPEPPKARVECEGASLSQGRPVRWREQLPTEGLPRSGVHLLQKAQAFAEDREAFQAQQPEAPLSASGSRTAGKTPLSFALWGEHRGQPAFSLWIWRPVP